MRKTLCGLTALSALAFGGGLATMTVIASAPAAVAQSCDAAAGKRIFARCRACHSLEEGKNGVGPHLFGVVGRPVASVEEYSYSDAMQAYAEGGAVWDRARLDPYLAKPSEEVPGTKMVFPGLPKEEDRQNVICYLEAPE